MMLTCMQKKVKIESKSSPEKHANHLYAEECVHQVQHRPEHHGDHLHTEKGQDNV